MLFHPRWSFIYTASASNVCNWIKIVKKVFLRSRMSHSLKRVYASCLIDCTSMPKKSNTSIKLFSTKCKYILKSWLRFLELILAVKLRKTNVLSFVINCLKWPQYPHYMEWPQCRKIKLQDTRKYELTTIMRISYISVLSHKIQWQKH